MLWFNYVQHLLGTQRLQILYVSDSILPSIVLGI